MICTENIIEVSGLRHAGLSLRPAYRQNSAPLHVLYSYEKSVGLLASTRHDVEQKLGQWLHHISEPCKRRAHPESYEPNQHPAFHVETGKAHPWCGLCSLHHQSLRRLGAYSSCPCLHSDSITKYGLVNYSHIV